MSVNHTTVIFSMIDNILSTIGDFELSSRPIDLKTSYDLMYRYQLLISKLIELSTYFNEISLKYQMMIIIQANNGKLHLLTSMINSIKLYFSEIIFDRHLSTFYCLKYTDNEDNNDHLRQVYHNTMYNTLMEFKCGLVISKTYIEHYMCIVDELEHNNDLQGNNY